MSATHADQQARYREPGASAPRLRIVLKIGSFVLTDEEVRRRKAYLEILPADEQRLREAHPLLQEQARPIIERFYAYLLAHDHTRGMLRAPGLIDRLEQLQTRYFAELTAGDYGLAYFENRLRVGLVHHKVGLAPEWYMGAYDRYLQIVSDVLQRAFGGALERYVETMASLTKVIHLDMSLALEAYFLSAHDALEQRAVALERANAEFVRLQAATHDLTDMIVHDLQNPLAGVIAFLQVLRAEGTDRPASERAALEEALRRCDDLSEMILNVLHVGRADSGRLEVRPEAVDLVELAQHAAASFRMVALRDDRSLAIEGPPSVHVVTDPSLVLRILGNLLRNAFRHTPRGTSVALRVAGGSGGASVSVIDHGAGIPPAIQPLVFERFSGAALRDAGIRVDSGLGLPFCKIAAQAIGASLSVESDGRRGTIFTLAFP